MRAFTLSLLGCVAVACTTAAPASPKPCVGRDGKVIPCPKHRAKPAPARCKDEKGRFIACNTAKSRPG